MSSADVAAYRRWRRILRWADGHEPEKAERARRVMASIWQMLSKAEQSILRNDGSAVG